MGKSPRKTTPVTGRKRPRSHAANLRRAAASSRTSGRAVQTILTIVLAVTPLCLLNGVFMSHDVIPKLILTLTCACLLLVLLPLWLPGLETLWQALPGRAFLMLSAAQCASLLVSMVTSRQPWLSVAGTVWRRFGTVEQIATLVIAIAAASATTLNGQWTRTLFRAMSCSGVLASVYGLFQYFGIDPFLDPGL